jgi:hypothetical protein
MKARATTWSLTTRPTLVRTLTTHRGLRCPGAEIDAAQTAPAVAARSRDAAVLAEAAAKPAQEVKQLTGTGKELAQGAYQLAKTQNAALALQAERDADAKELLAQRRANAKQTTDGEGRLPIELAILGALGSSCSLPLLIAFLRSLERRRA